jgi:hypothetical protein
LASFGVMLRFQQLSFDIRVIRFDRDHPMRRGNEGVRDQSGCPSVSWGGGGNYPLRD